MLKKIYEELVAIRKELQAIRKSLESSTEFVLAREPYSTRYVVVGAGQDECQPAQVPRNTKESEDLTGMEWRRFELLTEDEQERDRLERVLKKNSLSRQDLAVILLGLRVRPGFGKEDFGI